MKPWTDSELQTEWQYTYDERLSILGWYSQKPPPPELHELAKQDADEVVRKLKEGNHANGPGE